MSIIFLTVYKTTVFILYNLQMTYICFFILMQIGENIREKTLFPEAFFAYRFFKKEKTL